MRFFKRKKKNPRAIALPAAKPVVNIDSEGIQYVPAQTLPLDTRSVRIRAWEEHDGVKCDCLYPEFYVLRAGDNLQLTETFRWTIDNQTEELRTATLVVQIEAID